MPRFYDTYRSVPYPSVSTPGRWYRVDCLDGVYFCNCPSRNKPNCPHVIEERRKDDELRRRYAIVDKFEGVDMSSQHLPAVIQPDEAGNLVPAGYAPVELRPTGKLPTKDEFEMMKMIAGNAIAAASKATGSDRPLPASLKTPEQAMMVMLAGHEIGMPPITSTRRIFIVNGRTELETQALMGLVRAGDPSARFTFLKYERTGCTVRLERAGQEPLTISYDETDRKLSGQGMRKLRDMTRKVHGTNGDYNPYFNPPRYEDDPESPWHKYPRDMYAYNCIKRLCRLGAPEFTNGIGFAVNPAAPTYRVLETEKAKGDEDDAPQNDLTKALSSGELQPAAVFGESEPDAEDDSPPDDEQEPAASASDLDPVDDDEDEAPDLDAPPAAELIAEIERLMKDCRETWAPKDYAAMYVAFHNKYTPTLNDPENPRRPLFRLDAIRTTGTALELLRDLRDRRGESGLSDEPAAAESSESE